MQGLLEETFPKIQEVTNRLHEANLRFEICGKIRRGIVSGVINSVIIVVEAPTKEIHEVVKEWEPATFKTKPNTTCIRVGEMPIFLVATTEESWGSTLIFYTGHHDHKKCLCSIAKSQGLKLSMSGLWQGKYRIAGKDEKQIYDCLGLRYYPPKTRVGIIPTIRGAKRKQMRANSIQERKMIYKAIVKVFSERLRGSLPVKRSEVQANLDEYIHPTVLHGILIWLKSHGLVTQVKGGWLANSLPEGGICWEHGRPLSCRVCARKALKKESDKYYEAVRQAKEKPNVILGACGD